MRKTWIVLTLTAAAILCSRSYAATAYVLTNDNDPNGNTATLYRLNTVSGDLTSVGILQTGGIGLETPFGSIITQAASQDAGCVFVADIGSNDIATFSKLSGYGKVGNYSNGDLGWGGHGGSIALTPKGKFLYGSYVETGNIGAWAVNPDCSLTLIGMYIPTGGAAGYNLKVTPNGKYLVDAEVGFEGVELFSIDQTTGALTDVNYLSYVNYGNCIEVGCNPVGIDITADSRVVVFGGEGYSSKALFAEITPQGLQNPRVAQLKNSLGLGGPSSPVFSAAGYRGSGDLYFGMTGGPPTGVVTATITEQPPTFANKNATFTGGSRFQGVIAVTGNVMVVALFPNQIGVFSINPDGSLTQLNLITDPKTSALVSLSVFPDTR